MRHERQDYFSCVVMELEEIVTRQGVDRKICDVGGDSTSGRKLGLNSAHEQNRGGGAASPTYHASEAVMRSVHDLIGENLNSVEFLPDTYQLHFVNAHLLIEADSDLVIKGQIISEYEPGFRDELCKLIGKLVTKVAQPEDGFTLTLEFEDEDMLRVRKGDEIGLPESFVLAFEDEQGFLVCDE
jgi:hypothetical protein